MQTTWLQIRALIAGCFLLATCFLYKGFKDSRKIGRIDGVILYSNEVEKAFVSNVERRFSERIELKFQGQVLATVVKPIPLRYGGAVDKHYFAPDVSEVQRLIELAKNDMKYRIEVYDCDDFSRHFKDVLLLQWAKEGNVAPLPIVEVYGAIRLKTGEVVYHAFNAIITSDMKVVFVEPQGPTAISLRQARIIDIYSAVI